MAAQALQSEKQRLKVLWQYEVLDSVPEEMFDDLAELAAHICEAPVALISLVDERRQWFKSHIGFALPETSRQASFCSYAIQQSGLFIVPDATQDKRFAHNPLVVSDPKLRFYAGAPLITADGHALGTLCVLDKVPRTLRPDQQQALRVLARHVVAQLELRRHTRELARSRQTRETTRDELQRARTEIGVLKRQLARLKIKPAQAPASGRTASRPGRKSLC